MRRTGIESKLRAVDSRREDDEPASSREPLHLHTAVVHHPTWGALVKVLPGGCYVGYGEHKAVAVLGSCVSACVRDSAAGVGGMNHFLLPMSDAPSSTERGQATRYGVYAMELLINELVKRGARKSRLEVKLFGGANLFEADSPVGVRNIRFVKAFLEAEGVAVEAEDLGEKRPRKVVYCIRTGRARVKYLTHQEHRLVTSRDKEHHQHLAAAELAGPVELF